MAMKHPIDDPEPSKSNAMKKVASSLGLPVIDVKVTEPMIHLDIVIEETTFYGDTTYDFFDTSSSLEYRVFHESITDMARQVLGVKYALNHPICLSMLDDYKGMLIVMGVNFLEVKRY